MSRRFLALLAPFLVILIVAPPAVAVGTLYHPLVSEITQFETAPRVFETFEDPCGLAFDSAGDLYVANYYHDRIDVLEPSGGYITRLLNQEPLDGPCGLAVGASGALFVNDYHWDVLEYTPVEFPPQLQTPYKPPYGSGVALDSGHPTGVVLDPATGDLYVDERTYIDLYQAPVHPGEAPVRLEFGGSITDGYGIAVSDHGSTAGDLYVADAASGTVLILDPSEPAGPIGRIDGAGTPQGGFVSLRDATLAVDQSDGDLFVTDDLEPEAFEHPEAVLDEFAPAGLYRGQIARWTTSPEPGIKLEHHLVDSEPTGLAIAPGGDVYLTNGDSEGSAIDVFGPSGEGRVLTVSKSGAGEGTVTSVPAGIDCGTACASEPQLGAEITLRATPSPGSDFVGWSGACAGTAACSVTMSAARSVTANFEVVAAPLAAPSGADVSVVHSGAVAAPATGSAGDLNATRPASQPHRHRHRHHRRKADHRHTIAKASQ